MVTKSRLSPFANTRGRKGRKMTSEVSSFHTGPVSSSSTSKTKRWFSLVDAATLSHQRALLPVKRLRHSFLLNNKLRRTLYGFIVFEVAWKDVRGLNYLNELQTDTSLAIEAKFMNRWEFDSIAQAARCIPTWFPGTCNEQKILKDYLDSSIGEVFHDARENFPSGSCTEDFTGNDPSYRSDVSNPGSNFSLFTNRMEDEVYTIPPSDGPCKRRKLMKSMNADTEFDLFSDDNNSESVASPVCSPGSHANDHEDIVEPSEYRDVLILFRFNDHDLPFRLKDIIVSDLRLLTLLEAGLPSWVLFLQSYPVFCHIYRPWMCPLARALYVFISVVTVLIGFYDLYKNVPLLKATASHLFGPLFDWIETWEMITRIRYLGTMLFLHNFQKAVKWFLTMTGSVRSIISVIAQPMAGPLLDFLDFFLPLWNICIQVVESFFSVFWTVIESSSSLIADLTEMLLMPLWWISSILWSIASSFLYPMFCILWGIIYAPIYFVLGLYGLLVSVCLCLYESFRETWQFVSSIFQVSGLKSTVSSSEVSIWRSLWNDLFSQIFRAVRSILNGFVAFFTACNRHRLSIYNHGQEIVRRVHQPVKRKELDSSSTRRRLQFESSSPQGQTSGTRMVSLSVLTGFT
ncbi:OLC1v1024970C8 [Oldenlandia corymbosa var. corymbosa]|nr:OLC1v1024970C8 [Oldenlandia corymbosa var. corymbosa]